MKRTVAVLLLALALEGCASGPKHVATVAEQVAQSALIAVRQADQDLYEQGLVPLEKHREHQQALFRAFDLHEQAVKLTLLAPDGQASPAEYAAKVQEALLILNAIVADFPKSPAKDKAAAAVKGGL